jgi:hypothetical protein
MIKVKKLSGARDIKQYQKVDKYGHVTSKGKQVK